MKIPILTYHSMNVGANSYAGNDHLAFKSDLATVSELGFRIIPLSQVVDWHQGLLTNEIPARPIAITFDDGSWFDYYDLDHPTCGVQRSMFNILRDFQDKTDKAQPVHASSFVISSPTARSSLDKSCMIGRGWWGDEWWADAAASGIMSVECHSWDHVHPELSSVAQQDQIKGDFSRIQSFADCEIQFTQAGDYIGEQLAGRRPVFFAYPWGMASDYVVEQYLPNFRARHQFRAAFSIEPMAVSKSDNIWFLPRLVCGRDWQSPEGLKALLESL